METTGTANCSAMQCSAMQLRAPSLRLPSVPSSSTLSATPRNGHGQTCPQHSSPHSRHDTVQMFASSQVCAATVTVEKERATREREKGGEKRERGERDGRWETGDQRDVFGIDFGVPIRTAMPPENPKTAVPCGNIKIAPGRPRRCPWSKVLHPVRPVRRRPDCKAHRNQGITGDAGLDCTETRPKIKTQ